MLCASRMKAISPSNMEARVEGTYASPNSTRQSPASDLGLTHPPQAQDQHHQVKDDEVKDSDARERLGPARGRGDDATGCGCEHVGRTSRGTKLTDSALTSPQPTRTSLRHGRSNHRPLRRAPIVDPLMSLPNPFAKEGAVKPTFHRSYLSDPTATAPPASESPQLTLNLPTPSSASPIKHPVSTNDHPVAPSNSSSSYSPSLTVDSTNPVSELAPNSSVSPTYLEDRQSKMNGPFDNPYNGMHSAMSSNGFMNGNPQYRNSQAVQPPPFFENGAAQQSNYFTAPPSNGFDLGPVHNGTPQMTTNLHVAGQTPENCHANSNSNSVLSQNSMASTDARHPLPEALQRLQYRVTALTAEKEAYQKRLDRANDQYKQAASEFQQQVATLSHQHGQLLSQNTNLTEQLNIVNSCNQWLTSEVDGWKRRFAVARSSEQMWLNEARRVQASVAAPSSSPPLPTSTITPATSRTSHSAESTPSRFPTATGSGLAGTNQPTAVATTVNNQPQSEATSASSRASQTTKKSTCTASKTSESWNVISAAHPQTPAPSVSPKNSFKPLGTTGSSSQALALSGPTNAGVKPSRNTGPRHQATTRSAPSNASASTSQNTRPRSQAPLPSTSQKTDVTANTASGPHATTLPAFSNSTTASLGVGTSSVSTQSFAAIPSLAHAPVAANNTAIVNPNILEPGSANHTASGTVNPTTARLSNTTTPGPVNPTASTPASPTASDRKGKKRARESNNENHATKKKKADEMFAVAGYEPAAPSSASESAGKELSHDANEAAALMDALLQEAGAQQVNGAGEQQQQQQQQFTDDETSYLFDFSADSDFSFEI